MPVHFSTDRMDEVYEAHRRWWLGELERPLMRFWPFTASTSTDSASQ